MAGNEVARVEVCCVPGIILSFDLGFLPDMENDCAIVFLPIDGQDNHKVQRFVDSGSYRRRFMGGKIGSLIRESDVKGCYLVPGDLRAIVTLLRNPGKKFGDRILKILWRNFREDFLQYGLCGA